MRSTLSMPRGVSSRRLLAITSVASFAIAVAYPAAASATTVRNFCMGGLGPMAVCNQGFPHAIVSITTSNTSGDQSCETEKTGPATGSPLRYSWACANGVHGSIYDGASGYYAAVFNKTNGNRNMDNAFGYN